jgi:hypothetical protein
MLRWLAAAIAVPLFVVVGAMSFIRGSPAPSVSGNPGSTLEPERIHSALGRGLNPIGEIPKSGFKAFYYRQGDPAKTVFQENVDSVELKYTWTDFHKINLPNFGAYWVGKVTFAGETTRNLSVSQNGAASRIYVDGAVVFDQANSSRTFSHHFSAGDHVIEVEFANHSYSAEYKMTISDDVAFIDEDQVSSLVADGGVVPTNLYYVGLYETGARDTGVTVTLPTTGKTTVLWLTSYDAVDWNIVSSDRVSRVFVSSFGSGSRVRGLPSAKIYQLPPVIGVYREARRCTCSGGWFSCEDPHDLDDVAERLYARTGMRLNGYAVSYSASTLAIMPFTNSVARRIEELRATSDEAAQTCHVAAPLPFGQPAPLRSVPTVPRAPSVTWTPRPYSTQGRWSDPSDRIAGQRGLVMPP